MKRGVWLLVLIILLSSTTAHSLEEMGLTSERLELNLQISTNLTIVPLSSDYLISEVEYQLGYLPKNSWQQEVLSKEIEPTPTETADYLLFRWEDPASQNLWFRLGSGISVKNDLIKIRSKVNFPLTELDPELKKYTLPTANINSDNQELILLASNLSEGKDDLSFVVFSLFSWVADNIEYRKTALTESTSQSAIWVMENRYGVCDELTTIFMALARSIGIPARYVGGVAYTTYQGLNTWQPHGWAELYFPGYGWIPFDPTYREFGFVDPTHILLRYSQDSNESTSILKWIGRDVELQKSTLNLEVQLKENIGESPDLVNLELEVMKPAVGFGSYSLIRARVKNPNYFYVYTDLSLVPIRDFEILDGGKRQVLLAPFEKRGAYWIVRVSEGLNTNLIYTFPIKLITSRNTTLLAELRAADDYPFYQKEEMVELLEGLREEDEKVYSHKLSLSCAPTKPEFYIYENLTVGCELVNTGTSFLKELELCLEEKCLMLELPISHTLNQNLTRSLTKTGRIEEYVSVKSQVVSKKTSLAYIVLDQPNLTIENLGYPAELAFNGNYNITLKIKKNSESVPSNLSLIVAGPRKEERFSFGDLTDNQDVILEFAGKPLEPGPNSINLTLTYQDQNKRGYTSTRNLVIFKEKGDLFQRMSYYLSSSLSWLASWLDDILSKI